MQNLQQLDHDELLRLENNLDIMNDRLEGYKDDLLEYLGEEDFERFSVELKFESLKGIIDMKIADLQDQFRLNEEASEMQRDTMNDLDNSQR
jgi:hypothetical protein